MKILGIDPGLAILGWSILDKKADSSTQLLAFGTIQTDSQHSLSERLGQIYSDLQILIKKYKPSQLAIETLFFAKNAKTLAQVGHTRGVVLLSAGQNNLEISEYAPRQIKLALTGFGGAQKKQMQLVVQRLLNLSSIPHPDDAADAVAVALCHSQYSHHLGKVAMTV